MKRISGTVDGRRRRPAGRHRRRRLFRALPPAALVAYAELRATLEVAPWSGDSSSTTNPDGAVRIMSLACTDGSGFVYYLVLERERRVDVLDLVWLGR